MILPVFAHVGHGLTQGNTLAHYLTESPHLLTLCVVASLVGILSWLVARNRLQTSRVVSRR